MKLVLEFGGGLEALFGNQKQLETELPVPSDSNVTVGTAMAWARDNLLKERPELFMQGNTIRPGVLVLVNDADWELTGLENSALEDGDRLTFISTLHGG